MLIMLAAAVATVVVGRVRNNLRVQDLAPLWEQVAALLPEGRVSDGGRGVTAVIDGTPLEIRRRPRKRGARVEYRTTHEPFGSSGLLQGRPNDVTGQPVRGWLRGKGQDPEFEDKVNVTGGPALDEYLNPERRRAVLALQHELPGFVMDRTSVRWVEDGEPVSARHIVERAECLVACAQAVLNA